PLRSYFGRVISVHMLCLVELLGTTIESQHTEITQLFSARHLSLIIPIATGADIADHFVKSNAIISDYFASRNNWPWWLFAKPPLNWLFTIYVQNYTPVVIITERGLETGTGGRPMLRPRPPVQARGRLWARAFAGATAKRREGSSVSFASLVL